MTTTRTPLSSEHIVVAGQPRNVTVTEGHPFRLECHFDNDPPPTITWYHVAPNGTRTEMTSGVTQTGSQSVLGKPVAEKADRGTYVCEASNGVETAAFREYLTVLCESCFGLCLWLWPLVLALAMALAFAFGFGYGFGYGYSFGYGFDFWL